MLFQFNTDNHVDGNEAVSDQVEAIVRRKLGRVESRLSRVEVHIGDVNGPKGGNDIRCAVELRPKGMDPISATHEAADVEAAAASAVDKALSGFDKQIGRQTTRKGH